MTTKDDDDLDDLIGKPGPPLMQIRKGVTLYGTSSLISRLTREEIAKMGKMLLERDVESIKETAQSETANALQVILASVCLRIIDKGDMQAFDCLLNRLVGKVREEVHHTGDNVAAPQIIVSLPSNGRELKNVTPKCED